MGAKRLRRPGLYRLRLRCSGCRFGLNRRSRLAHDEIIAVHRFRDVRLLTLKLLQFALKLRDFLLASFFLLDFFLTQAFLLQQRLFSLLLALFSSRILARTIRPSSSSALSSLSIFRISCIVFYPP